MQPLGVIVLVCGLAMYINLAILEMASRDGSAVLVSNNACWYGIMNVWTRKSWSFALVRAPDLLSILKLPYISSLAELETLAIVSKNISEKKYLLKESVVFLGCNRFFGFFLGVLYPENWKQNTPSGERRGEKYSLPKDLVAQIWESD